ncbi:zf-HC2 domain-containing protein [Streptomyces atratus]|uniref:MDMPI N domain containing protein n=1 Tax=Streptomyces atratus TaxID=1893 RepID=A0A2Z5JRC1_STRAR|nr:zf-HC2 domain-containing protein [Streptomyces atratus]AXE83000.1 MDMPI N domain containing protein [Streptomyces atratus]
MRSAPRIPGPRAAADDFDLDAFPLPPPVPATEPEEPRPAPQPTTPEPESAAAPPAPSGPPAAPALVLPHRVLKALLGAWALAACSAEEAEAVEAHLTVCAACADEALRLRDAVGLLQTDRSLDLDPALRSRVIDACLSRRPANIPVPHWAAPYDAETARLDALLRDIGGSEWHAPVRLKWFEGERAVNRKTTVAGVIGHLMTVDGLVGTALGMDLPLGDGASGRGVDWPRSPGARTEKYWSGARRPLTRAIRGPWREQSHALIRTVSFAGRKVAELSVSYGDFALPMHDSLLDRAFECWVHGGDIAEAVDYPYEAPSAAHLNRMIDLAARLLPAALAERRGSGPAGPARHVVTAGSPGRSLHLEVEGSGGGDWYIPLDSPAAVGSPAHAVAQVALDSVEFCQLVAGHVPPVEAAAGQQGDREAIRDVLFAAASLSRL